MSQQNTPRNTKRYNNSPFVAPKQHAVGSSSPQPNTNHATSPIYPFGGENTVSIIPGPLGILQAAKLHKTTEIRECGHECAMPTQEYVRKIIKDANEDDHFTLSPWLSAVQYLNLEGGIASGCFGDMKTFYKNGKLEKVIAVIKSCTPHALGELTVTLKDHSGTIHHKVLIEADNGKSITVGVVRYFIMF
ncbi:RNA-directed DNA polymerase, eukaryota [Tanacetum coccineum]